MSTDELRISHRRRRNNRSPEFKAQIVAECMQVGVSVAGISRQYGLNPNLVYRWVSEFEQMQAMTSVALSGQHSVEINTTVKPNFIELPFRAPVVQADSCEGIEFDFKKGDLTLKVKWPASSALECVHMIKSLFKC